MKLVNYKFDQIWMKSSFDIDKYCKILYIFIKYQKTPKDYSGFGSTVYNFFQIFSQSGWLVENWLFEHILDIGFISFTFVHANQTKFMPIFIKNLNKILQSSLSNFMNKTFESRPNFIPFCLVRE
jgi:hypothetical protein